MKGPEAEEPSRVKTSTRAVTDFRGCKGCGVMGYAAGVARQALFNGVLIGVLGASRRRLIGLRLLLRGFREELGVCLLGFAPEKGM